MKKLLFLSLLVVSGTVLCAGNREKLNIELCQAALRNKPRDIIDLIKQGANVNCNCGRDAGFSPLVFATLQGHKEATETLITQGANVHVSQSDGSTALDYAFILCRPDLAAILHKAGAHTSSRHSVDRSKCSSEQVFKEMKALERKEDEKRNATLCDAAARNDTQIISTFLEKHSSTDINCDCNGISGFTPLVVAAAQGHLQATQLILSKDKTGYFCVDTNPYTADQKTIIERTVELSSNDKTPEQRESRKKVVEVLLQQERRSSFSEAKALELSLQNCRPDLATVLHKGGAHTHNSKLVVNRNQCLSEQDFQTAQDLICNYQGVFVLGKPTPEEWKKYLQEAVVRCQQERQQQNRG